MERQWSLETVKGANKPEEIAPVKQCPECFRTVHTAIRACPECEYEFRQEQEEPEVIDIDLVEVTEPVITIDTRELKDLKTVADLYSYGKSRGYKSGWAYFQAKQRGWL